MLIQPELIILIIILWEFFPKIQRGIVDSNTKFMICGDLVVTLNPKMMTSCIRGVGRYLHITRFVLYYYMAVCRYTYLSPLLQVLDWPTPSGWTKANATKFCEDFLMQSEAFKKCNMTIDDDLEMCVEDIKV